MAYQDTLSPAEVLNAEITRSRRAMDRIGSFFRSIGQSITMAAVARARFETLTQLQGKSDAELEQLGLKRDELVRHVFNDLYYA